MQYLNTWGAKRRETGDLCAPYDKKLISLHHLSRSQQVFKALHAFGCYASTYLVALRPSESLGHLNYGCPFFSAHCHLSPSCNLHLVFIPFSILHPSQSRSSYSSSLQFTLKHLLTVLSWSILTTCPIHCSLFCLVSATMSRSFYSCLNSCFDLILHIPCSTTALCILLNTLLSHVPTLFISIACNTSSR